MDVTRNEFTALAARVTVLEGAKPPVPVPAPPVTPTKGIVLGVPKVTITGTAFTVQAVVRTYETASFTYLQLAVRGAGAGDLALTPNAVMKAGDAKTLLGSGVGLGGPYSACLAYSKDGSTWVEGPKVAFTIAAPVVVPPSTDPPSNAPAGVGVPLAGKSKLGFNSLVFRSAPRDAETFGARRGTPMDGLLTFSTRGSWDDFNWVPDGTADYLASGHIVVNSMPHAPESEGDQMNAKGANNSYKEQQRAIGAHIKNSGLNMAGYAIRLDWECNGDWYHWSANRPGGVEALREAIKNYVINVRAGGGTKVKFNLCFNKGPSQAGHDFDIFPGAEYIDVIGIDDYDMWSPSYTQADWEREMAKSPSPRSVAAFATQHGIQWSWDEGGNTHGDQAGVYGGDNPMYWRLRRGEITRNIKNLAWDNTYDERGAPATLAHDFDQNPVSWPVYKQLWTPA